MNQNVGGPFHPAYNSSTSLDDENVFVNALSIAQEQEEMIIQHIAHNNMMIARYLASQNQQVAHVGSIPGHIVIKRDREAADRICSRTTLPKTHVTTVPYSVVVFECPRVCSFELWMLSKLMTTTSSNATTHLVDRACQHYKKQHQFFGCSHMVCQRM